ncbi:MAG: phasin family protein [Leptolyngbyaceae cyanobacterium]|mgnify:CR=1 FL=1
MAGFGDLVQKAFYLGIGAASYAGEKAGGTLKELREQTQAIVNELVERGELTAEEAQQLFNKMMQQAQENATTEAERPAEGPRRIEILDDTADTGEAREAEALRQQVESMRQQLNELKRKQ